MDKLVEVVARAIHESCSQQDVMGYLDANLDCEILAQAALSAIREAGYVVVPAEPTEGMICAGIIDRHEQPVPEAWSLATVNIYKAMIAAGAIQCPTPATTTSTRS